MHWNMTTWHLSWNWKLIIKMIWPKTVPSNMSLGWSCGYTIFSCSKSGRGPLVDMTALRILSMNSRLMGVGLLLASFSCSPAASRMYTIMTLLSSFPLNLHTSMLRICFASFSRLMLPSMVWIWLRTCFLAPAAADSTASNFWAFSGCVSLDMLSVGSKLANWAEGPPISRSRSECVAGAWSGWRHCFHTFSTTAWSSSSSSDCWCRTACFTAKSYPLP